MGKRIPYGKMLTPSDLGKVIRAKRKADGLTQVEAGLLCGLGPRFIGEVEKGKPTSEIGKILRLLSGLGIELTSAPRGLDGHNDR